MTNEHELCETAGIPTWLAHLEEGLVECLPKDKAKEFHLRVSEAIPVGVNLDPVRWKFCAFLLKENIDRVLSLEIDAALKEKVVSAIRQCLGMYENAIATGVFDYNAARSAESAAWSAWSAWAAAEYAWSAAESARHAAAAAAWSVAGSAAWSAAWSAGSAGSAAGSAWSAAGSAAGSAAYERYAEKLLELLREAK